MRRLLLIAAALIVSGCAANIHKAAAEGDRDDVRRAIKSGADVNARDAQGRTPLYLAAAEGHDEMVRELIGKQSADVNARDSSGSTPLHAAAALGHKQVVSALLVAGADPTMKDSLGRTPLDLATLGQHSKCIAELQAALSARATQPAR